MLDSNAALTDISLLLYCSIVLLLMLGSNQLALYWAAVHAKSAAAARLLINAGISLPLYCSCVLLLMLDSDCA